MKTSDSLNCFLPRTHHDGFSTAAFENDFEELSRVCIIIYCDYLDVSKSSVRYPFFFFKGALPDVRRSNRILSLSFAT